MPANFCSLLSYDVHVSNTFHTRQQKKASLFIGFSSHNLLEYLEFLEYEHSPFCGKKIYHLFSIFVLCVAFNSHCTFSIMFHAHVCICMVDARSRACMRFWTNGEIDVIAHAYVHSADPFRTQHHRVGSSYGSCGPHTSPTTTTDNHSH